MGVRCGLPAEQFYRLNPKLLKRWQPYFNEAMLQSEKDLSKAGWVNGYYVRSAVASSFSKKAKYPEEPIFQGYVRGDNNEEAHKLNDAERFMIFATQFNKSFKSKEEKQ